MQKKQNDEKSLHELSIKDILATNSHARKVSMKQIL